jgi:hypothetical protein
MVKAAGKVPVHLPRLPIFPHDRITRYLCYAVHVDENLRDYVLHTVVNSHLQAICPSYGVNLACTARHAVLAQRRRSFRETAFMVLRLLLLAGIAAGLVFRSVAVAVAVAVLAVVLVAAWGVLFWNVRADGLSALRVVTDSGEPEDQAGPLRPEVEERLKKLDRANTVVYADGEGDPFIGSGRRLHFFEINPVDVTRAGDGAGGAKRTITPFDAIELHQYLAVQIPALGFDGLRVRNRLYVRGDYALHVPGLLPDKLAAPEPVIHSDWVKSAVEHPADLARTYICLERIMSGGDLVVSMYVRAWLEQDLLSIERIIYFLPPLQRHYRPTHEFVARGAVGVTLDAGLTAARRLMPVLAGRPVAGRQPVNYGRLRERSEAKARRQIKAGIPYDYGARTSLREAAAAYNTKEHFAEADVIDSFKRLGSRLMNCIEKFLDDHGIDTSDFRNQIQLIDNSVSHIGTIQAGTAVVGGQGNIIAGHGAVNNFVPGQAGAQPGGSSPQGTT